MDGWLDLLLRTPPNRVYRFYRGGALIDTFRGTPDPQDTDYPEDWVGSTTAAINPADRTYAGEGLSTVEMGGETVTLASLLETAPIDVVGQAVVDRYGATSALLVKLLDASIRLPVHGRPTRDFARHILDSQFGKAESWPPARSRARPPLASGWASRRPSIASNCRRGSPSRTPRPSAARWT